MRVMHGLRVATLLLAAVACDRVVLTPAELPGNFTEWLDGCSEVFTQSAPPAGVVDPHAVVEDLRVKGFPPFAPPGAPPTAPVFGVVSNGPPNDCHGGGIVSVGEELAVWFVVWPDVPGANGGLAWALVDARSGAFLAGDGPPGGQRSGPCKEVAAQRTTGGRRRPDGKVADRAVRAEAEQRRPPTSVRST